MAKRILHLTLYKKWFDLTASGEKKHDYRECKPHWEKRLTKKDGTPKHFDEIHYRNGYGKNRPLVRVKFGGIGFTSPKFWKPKHGEKLWPSTIVITNGPVLEVRR